LVNSTRYVFASRTQSAQGSWEEEEDEECGGVGGSGFSI
jgi:hypothetical protein